MQPPHQYPPLANAVPNNYAIAHGNQVSGLVTAPVIDQVRKWSVKYEGGRDPLAFVERLEELAEVYMVNIDLLPKIMPEVLCNTALQWYRNNNEHWDNWADFKQDFLRFFLPARYFERLEDDIRQRRQHAREKYKDYVLAIQTLMRHAGYSSEQRLERIFRNSHPDYLLYIRRRDFSSLTELLTLAEDYEGIHEGHRRTSEVPRREMARHVVGEKATVPRPSQPPHQQPPRDTTPDIQRHPQMGLLATYAEGVTWKVTTLIGAEIRVSYSVGSAADPMYEQ